MSSIVNKRDKCAGDVEDLDWDSSVVINTDDQPLLHDECKQRRKHHRCRCRCELLRNTGTTV